MASMQCCKPENVQTCQQKSSTEHAQNWPPKSLEHGSFGQKVSEMASKAFGGNHHHAQQTSNHTKCHSKTETYHTDHEVVKTHQTHFVDHTNGQHGTVSHNQNKACQPCVGKTHKKKEKHGLFHRIKDRLSGDSSSSDSSESDGDNDACHERKN